MKMYTWNAPQGSRFSHFYSVYATGRPVKTSRIVIAKFGRLDEIAYGDVDSCDMISKPSAHALCGLDPERNKISSNSLQLLPRIHTYICWTPVYKREK